MPDATRPLFSLLGAIVVTSHGVVATLRPDGLEHGDAATWGIGEKTMWRHHVRDGINKPRGSDTPPHAAPDRNWIGTQGSRPPQKLKKMAGGLP